MGNNIDRFYKDGKILWENLPIKCTHVGFNGKGEVFAFYGKPEPIEKPHTKGYEFLFLGTIDQNCEDGLRFHNRILMRTLVERPNANTLTGDFKYPIDSKIKHLKTNGVYTVTGYGKLEHNAKDAYAYKSDETGVVWFRDKDEVEDGRFVSVEV